MRKRRVLRWPVVLRWRAWVVIHSELLWGSLIQQPTSAQRPLFRSGAAQAARFRLCETLRNAMKPGGLRPSAKVLPERGLLLTVFSALLGFWKAPKLRRPIYIKQVFAPSSNAV